MKLFYLTRSGENGDNLDLFVRADTKARAFDLWSDYYGIPLGTDPMRCWEVPPVTGSEGAVSWGLVEEH